MDYNTKEMRFDYPFKIGKKKEKLSFLFLKPDFYTCYALIIENISEGGRYDQERQAQTYKTQIRITCGYRYIDDSVNINLIISANVN